MMRIALVATPLPLPDMRPAPGALDGDVIRSRLPLDDSGFRLVDIDPAVDLAEQIETLFERGEIPRDAAVLFYASSSVILSVEGELFLALDPSSPDTGDSVRDLALVFRERSEGPLAFVIECRHAPDPEDPFRSASVAAAARDAVSAGGGRIELLVAAQPILEGEAEDRVSPLTRALIEALDEQDAALGITLRQFYESARESPQIAGRVPGFAYGKASTAFELMPLTDEGRARAEAPVSREAPAEDEVLVEDEGAHEVPVTEEEPVTEASAEGDEPAIEEPEAPADEATEPSEEDVSTAEMEPLAEDEIAEVLAAAADEAATVPYRSDIAVEIDEPVAPPQNDAEELAAPVPNPAPDKPAPVTMGPHAVPNPAPDKPAPVTMGPHAVPNPAPDKPAPSRSESVSVPIAIEPARASEPDPLPRVVINAPPPKPASIAPPKAASVAPPPKPTSVAPPKSESIAPPSPASSEAVTRPSPPPAKPVSIAPEAPSAKPVSIAPEAPSAKPVSIAPEAPKAASVPPPEPVTASDHMAAGDALRTSGDYEGALAAYKRALAMLSSTSHGERADIYARQGLVKQAQDKRREAIAAFEKAIQLAPLTDAGVPPAHATALAALVELNVAEGDWKAVGVAEERVLATLRDEDDRFTHLLTFGARWQGQANDVARARATFERARDLRPDDLRVLEKLRAVYEQAGAAAELFATRLRIAELTRDLHARAEQYFALGQHCLFELRREELGLELLDKALESDPTMLEPLAVIARVLADKQEWSELEQAYRRMLDRVEHTPEGPTRTEVTWELCRRLGNTFRDHLDDPALALDAFEDAVNAKPNDLATRLTTAEIARSLGKNDRAVAHLETAAALDPSRVATFHDLFECFQKLRRPDQAFQAASVSMFLRQADARERFIFEEHKPEGVLKPAYSLRPESWEWLRPHDRDMEAEAVLAAVTPAAIAARLAQLEEAGRLPALDPAGRQDPDKSTVSIVRSFTWASHFLGVPAPAVYLSDEPQLALASVIAEEPTVFAGQKVLRGRSLPELAFFVGRHLAYHVGGHRLLLYYPSIEDLTACFLAAVRIILPEVPAPAPMRATVMELERAIALRLGETARVDLAAAVAAFEAGGSRAHLTEWVAVVERCATRAGYLLAGDLDVVAGVLKNEPRGLLDADAKMSDLLGFAVSDELRALREALGIAIQP
ncbi:Gluconokinase [Minicystis rosea]|nr:Gluconokinase [Minicystis rosea]